jgi:methyl-accepting chemotaxis protein
VIAGGTYEDEITRKRRSLRNRAILSGLVALAVFAAILYAVVRTVTRPLAEARDAAVRIAQGDLTVSLAPTARRDRPAGCDAMNEHQQGLSNVVGQVRSGAEQIANASNEISSGNLDLCARTEQQAASLAVTASSMQDLTETVRQNAGDAHQANQLAVNTSMVAQEGGRMVSAGDRHAWKRSSSRRARSRHHRRHRRHRLPDQYPGAERGRGSGARRRTGPRLRGRGQRSAQPGPAQAAAAKEIKGLIQASARGRRRQPPGAGSRHHHGRGAGQRRAGDRHHGRISAASTEQTGGIEHINRAIGEMDQVTQHNAALVEEASAAAQAMQEQACIGTCARHAAISANLAASAGVGNVDGTIGCSFA